MHVAWLHRLVSLQLFKNKQFIVMSKMQKGVHGWCLTETWELCRMCYTSVGQGERDVFNKLVQQKWLDENNFYCARSFPEALWYTIRRC
jgi:hypothetical protein